MHYYQILQWHHIRCLYCDSADPQCISDREIIIYDKGHFTPQKRRRGNPQNLARADVISRMMKLIFPAMDESTKEYTRMRAKVSEYRRLGSRLHKLVEKFGDGVLGILLPVSECGQEENGLSTSR